jgi:hypothetical protein
MTGPGSDGLMRRLARYDRPGTTLPGGPPLPSRWERLRADVKGRPVWVLIALSALIATPPLAVYAAADRNPHRTPATTTPAPQRPAVPAAPRLPTRPAPEPERAAEPAPDHQPRVDRPPRPAPTRTPRPAPAPAPTPEPEPEPGGLPTLLPEPDPHQGEDEGEQPDPSEEAELPDGQ